MPRTEQELLTAVYARSRAIRLRRRLLRGAAATMSVVVAAVAIVALPGDSRDRDKVKTVDDPGTTTTTISVTPTTRVRPSPEQSSGTGPGQSAIDDVPATSLAPPQGSGVVSAVVPPAADAPAAQMVGEIAFSTFDAIYIVNPDGSGLRPVTEATSTTVEPPSWSPDGQQIAFVFGTIPQVWVVNRDGTGRRQVSTLDGAASDPRWSPDGASIAFVTTRPDPTSVYVTYWIPGFHSDSDVNVIASNGSSQRAVTSGANNDRSPIWSPDGSRLAYFSLRGESDGAYTVGVDGTDERILWPHGDNFVPSIDWSSDGTIAIASSHGDPSDGVWLLDPDGSNRRKVSSVRGAYAPAFSPDGSFLAYGEIPDDYQDGLIIHVLELSSGSERTLRARAAMTSWSPDSRSLTFCDADGVYRLDRDASRSTLIAATDSCVAAAWSP